MDERPSDTCQLRKGSLGRSLGDRRHMGRRLGRCSVADGLVHICCQLGGDIERRTGLFLGSMHLMFTMVRPVLRAATGGVADRFVGRLSCLPVSLPWLCRMAAGRVTEVRGPRETVRRWPPLLEGCAGLIRRSTPGTGRRSPHPVKASLAPASIENPLATARSQACIYCSEAPCSLSFVLTRSAGTPWWTMDGDIGGRTQDTNLPHARGFSASTPLGLVRIPCSRGAGPAHGFKA
jgi:hypothetical protein